MTRRHTTMGKRREIVSVSLHASSSEVSHAKELFSGYPVAVRQLPDGSTHARRGSRTSLIDATLAAKAYEARGERDRYRLGRLFSAEKLSFGDVSVSLVSLVTELYAWPTPLGR